MKYYQIHKVDEINGHNVDDMGGRFHSKWTTSSQVKEKIIKSID